VVRAGATVVRGEGEAGSGAGAGAGAGGVTAGGGEAACHCSKPTVTQMPLPSVLGTTPMRLDLVEKAQQVLTVHIGPIAPLLARRAAASAATREQFFTTLADQAGEHIDRKRLLAQLWRIA